MLKVQELLKRSRLLSYRFLSIGKGILSKGFTLVEVLVVIVILGVLGAIAVVSLVGITERAEEEVCNTNRLQLERDFQLYIMLEGKEETNITFTEFLIGYDSEICPVGGEISYVNEEVECSIHSHEGEDEDNEDGEVPYL